MKVLPLNENPFLYGYTHYTYMQAILTNPEAEILLEKMGYKNWFYTNYIQLHCRNLDSQHFDSLPIEFYVGDMLNNKEYIGNPFLDIQWMYKDLILSFANITEYLIHMIDKGYYADLIIDEFYVPNSEKFNRQHFFHQNLLYGYDLDKEEFKLFGVSSNNNFRALPISFDLFRKAFKNSYSTNGNFWCRPINFLKLRLPEKYYEIDLRIMIQFLEDYLYSRNTNRLLGYCFQAKERIFGLDVYNTLFYIIKSNIGDLRMLHVLWQHKKCMTKRIEFLYNKGLLSYNEYIKYQPLAELIETTVLVIRNLQIKYTIKNDELLLDKIKKGMFKIKDVEKNLYSELITSLKQHIGDSYIRF